MTGTALFIIDVQADFLPPTGSLAVPNGRDVIPVIAGLLDSSTWAWDLVVASQDYHPPDHISFASSHRPHKAFDRLTLTDARGTVYEQTLWPDHCVQSTGGEDIDPEIVEEMKGWGDKLKIVHKGWHQGIEAYSAFEGYIYDKSKPSPPPDQLSLEPSTEVTDYLRAQGISKVVITGLATDFCVRSTALSALSAGFETLVLAPAVRAISDTEGEAVFERIGTLGGTVVGRGDAASWKDELRRWIGK